MESIKPELKVLSRMRAAFKIITARIGEAIVETRALRNDGMVSDMREFGASLDYLTAEIEKVRLALRYKIGV